MNKSYRWARRAVWGTFVVVCTIGCNPLTTIAFLTHKDTKIPAEFPLTYKEGPKKDKEEIVVALFVSQSSGSTNMDSVGADTNLANEIIKKLPEMVKETKQKQKLTVLTSAQINKFKMKNPNWKLMHATERGKQLGADFVLEIHIEKMSLYQPGSQNSFYEGRADVTVDMFDVEDGATDPMNTYSQGFAFPKTGFRDASTMPPSAFRRAFLEKLALEICERHVEHHPSSGIADGR